MKPLADRLEIYGAPAAVEPIVEIKNPHPTDEAVITVAVSLFNYAEFVVDCLNSIRDQTYSALDLIVVDDHSNADESVDVARAWLRENASRFERVLLLRHRRNQGLAMARNTGFVNALGETVFVMDADNEIYPRAIARLSQALNDSGAAAAYSQLEMFGSEQRLGYADVWNPQRFKSGNYVDAMALVSKWAWRSVGGYSHIEGGWEDYDFWCKFVEHDLEAIFLPQTLCRYRVHGQSMLRTVSEHYYSHLYVSMAMRHPWLELPA